MSQYLAMIKLSAGTSRNKFSRYLSIMLISSELVAFPLQPSLEMLLLRDLVTLKALLLDHAVPDVFFSGKDVSIVPGRGCSVASLKVNKVFER